MSSKADTSDQVGGFIGLCFLLISIIVLIAPGIFLSGPPYMGALSFVPITIVFLILFSFVCIIAIGKYEEKVYGPVSTTQKSEVPLLLSSSPPPAATSNIREATTEQEWSQRRLVKTSTGQLFWQAEETRRIYPKEVTSKVRAVRGGEIIGGRFRFKIKVLNESPYTINDVTVYILSYPRDTLILKTEDDDIFFSKIEPQGFRSPSFDFLPTQDCVRGEIVAGVSYVDASGKAHTLTTESYTIRAVCDLLQPEAITAKGFELKLKGLESGEILLKVEEWTPEEMREKTLRVLSDSNFHEVSSDESKSNDVLHFRVSGWAKGKYTGKNIGTEIFITGVSGHKGASCRIRVAGEDDAMILPAIDDLKERLAAYLCPMCGSKLTMDNVEDLKKGKIVSCPFCDVSIGR